MKLGRKLAEGKTKIVYEDAERSDCVVLESKDSITAGDGARRNFIPGKGAISGRTTANCFAFLNANGVATHFVEVIDDTHLRAKKCSMIPVEAVARRIATGSFLKRHPEITEGTRF